MANAVQANIQAMLSTGNLGRHEVCNIACGQQTSLNELWSIVSNLVGVQQLLPIYGPGRVGDVRDSLADISKAKNLLGYSPSVYLAEGLKMI